MQAVTPEIRHYIEWLFPGSFFAETSAKRVISRIRPPGIPKGAYGYQFFDRIEVEAEGETLYGRPKNRSGIYYLGGKVLTLAQVKSLPGDYKTLISNMECNRWDRVIKLECGAFQPFNDNDQLVEV